MFLLLVSMLTARYWQTISVCPCVRPTTGVIISGLRKNCICDQNHILSYQKWHEIGPYHHQYDVMGTPSILDTSDEVERTNIFAGSPYMLVPFDKRRPTWHINPCERDVFQDRHVLGRHPRPPPILRNQPRRCQFLPRGASCQPVSVRHTRVLYRNV